ncbi:hypothetical protein CDL12_09239 [Handroanthus impetiginosus]|uniref:Uncharacterized protein n=1 Tax=Handroanthus impetiginosus TaxID=429701 RepID=A0A2G9HKY4_9LAMI|nr:hypothetical protein CDL12_09239 [Handroanthus impetiginosus]
MHAHTVQSHDLQTVNHIYKQHASTTALVTILLLLLLHGGSSAAQSDVDLLEFPLNLEYLEAEFFSWGALGRGLDSIEPNLTMGGPPPVGVRKADLSPLVQDIIAQFAYQEVGHLRKKPIKEKKKKLLIVLKLGLVLYSGPIRSGSTHTRFSKAQLNF